MDKIKTKSAEKVSCSEDSLQRRVIKNPGTTFKGQVVFWADPTDLQDSVEAEYHEIIKPMHEDIGLYIKNIAFTDLSPLKGHDNEIYYDLLLFDWGGMSLGNSLLQHFAKYIIDEAKECPSRYYVMVSTFTSEAMKEALDEFGDNRPQNIFLDFNSFVAWQKRYGQ